MSDQEEHDWLDEELNKLGHLEAPETLFPRVMHVVRRKATQPSWIRFLNSATFRSILLAFATVTLGVLFLVNPMQLFSEVPLIVVPLKLAAILLDTIESLLLQYRVFNLPVLVFIIPAIIASYGLLVATAASVQRLVGLQK
jgi:hypothetical protein